MLKVAATVASTHSALSLASIGYGVFFTGQRAEWPKAAEEDQPPSKEAEAVLEVVAGMYSGRGLSPDSCTSGCTFEDPAALCRGNLEVVEAFRALKATRPEHVAPPRLHVPAGEPDRAVVTLHQRYFGFLEVRSTLHVHFEESGRMCSIEERWNAVPLLRPANPVRRLNGVLSSVLTPIVIR